MFRTFDPTQENPGFAKKTKCHRHKNTIDF